MSLHRKRKFIPGLGFSFLTDYYDLITKILMPSNFREFLVCELKLTEGQKVLDFGAGTAEIALLIKKTCPGVEVVAVDADPRILRIASKKIEASGSNIVIIQNDKSNLPFEDNYFDKVISCLVFCSLDIVIKKQVLFEIYRILKEGGAIFIADWGPDKNPLKRNAMKVIHSLAPFRSITNTHNQLLFGLDATGFKRISLIKSIATVTGTLNYYSASK